MNSPRHRAVVLEPGYRDYEVERRILEDLAVEVVPVPPEQDAVAAVAALDAAAILVRERPVPAPVIAAAPSLKVIVRYGVGVDNVDLEAARERRIYVANVPDYGAEEVSDHAVALYYAVARRIVSRDAQVRAGVWNVGQAEPVYGARHQTLGIVGFGRIAHCALRKFHAIGFERVLVADPVLNAADVASHHVEVAEIDEICATADVISLHAPLTDATRHVMDARRLGLMKPTAILINTARGGLVDEAALTQALLDGRIFGAGIDVFESEPPARDNPLLGCTNAVLTDHMGWYAEASVAELQHKAAEEVHRVLSGEPPHHWVNDWRAAPAL